MPLKVRVLDYDVITVKPKVTAEIKQYIIVTEDMYGHSEVFFVDADKYDKAKFTELVRQKYASRYRLAPGDVEVEFIVDIRRA